MTMNRGVDRLHGRVREKRQLVGRFQPVAGGKALGDIAVGFRDRAVLFAGGAQIAPDVVRAEACVRAFVPVDHQRVEAFLGRPHVIADHRDQIVEHDDLLHAGDFPGGAVVDLADLAAEYRTGLQRREFHAGQHRIDAVDGLAVDLVGGVEPLQRLADQHEILRVLERDILWRHLAVRRQRQRAIGKLAPLPCASPRCWLSCSLPDRPAIAGRRPAPAWRARRRRRCAEAATTPGPNWNCRWPECRTADCRKACRSAAHARASLAQNRHRVLRPGSSATRCRRPVPSRPAASPAWSCRRVDADEGVRRELAVGHVRRLHRLVDRAHRKMEREQKSARQAAGQQAAA